MTEALGEQLRRLRLARRMTAEQLSAASGVALRTIYRIERGEQLKPRKVTVRALFLALSRPGGEGSGDDAQVGRSSSGLGIDDHLAAILSHIDGLSGQERLDFIGALNAMLDGLAHAGTHPVAVGDDDL